jgi:predicted cupin superfamily sugar epimerase
MTTIAYLLSAEHFSAFHRLKSDEVWHHYRGARVAVEIIDAHGGHRRVIIGDGHHWQCALPAGAWFAAYVCHSHDFALIGCDVAPGFEFEDFELAEREALVARFPQHRELIERYTRV